MSGEPIVRVQHRDERVHVVLGVAELIAPGENDQQGSQNRCNSEGKAATRHPLDHQRDQNRARSDENDRVVKISHRRALHDDAAVHDGINA